MIGNHVGRTLHRIINEGVVREAEKFGLTKEIYHPIDRLIIFSSLDDHFMDERLVDSMEVVRRLQNIRRKKCIE